MSGLEPDEVELRRAARERALELLYEAEVKGIGVTELLTGLPLPPAPLADELVRGVEAHRGRIDELLARRVAPRWSLQRLAAVDRAVLRLGTYELMEATDRSQALIINEAVVLARRFGSDDSPRFVNGVLAAVAAEVRPGDGDDAHPGRDAGPMVDALVIDMDGVIRHWDDEPLGEVERELGLPEGVILAAAFESDRLRRAMRGDISFEQWADEIGAVVAADHDVAAAAVGAAFSEVGWRIDESVLDLVDEVRDRVPVALLSNASSRLVADLERSAIADRFDAVVGSADIGAVKPEPEAFRAATDRLGVSPERCLYVDDTEENVTAAARLGMRVVHFADVDQLADELTAAGLIAPG